MFHIKVPQLLSSYLLCSLISVHGSAAQSRMDGVIETHSHGTCIGVARRNDDVALAADGRETDDLRKLSSTTCKLLSPTPNLVFAVTGIEKAFEIHTLKTEENKQYWDADEVAADIFAKLKPQTPEDLRFALDVWGFQVQTLIDAGHFQNLPENAAVVQLLAVTTSPEHPRLVVTSFFVRDHVIHRNKAKIWSDPSPDEVRIQFFGSCNKFFEHSEGEQPFALTDSEREKKLQILRRYRSLTEVGQMRSMLLDFDDLASDISQRVSQDTHVTQDIAPPYSSSERDPNIKKWSNFPAPGCENVLHTWSGSPSR